MTDDRKCNDTRPCFARNNNNICSALNSTYPPGKCPFCKPKPARDMRLVSETVYRYRLLSDMTKEELAEATCCMCSTIEAIEAGKFLPGPSLAARLADALGITVRELGDDR